MGTQLSTLVAEKKHIINIVRTHPAISLALDQKSVTYHLEEYVCVDGRRACPRDWSHAGVEWAVKCATVVMKKATPVLLLLSLMSSSSSPASSLSALWLW